LHATERRNTVLAFQYVGGTMDAMSIKLPRSLSARVSQVARRRNVTRTQVVREALELYVRDEGAPRAGRLDDLKGCLKGLPRDLSTNAKHLKGYGT
jgi:hypothetical protein